MLQEEQSQGRLQRRCRWQIQAKRTESHCRNQSPSRHRPLPNKRPVANLAGTAGLRISTFESEIDPLEFSLLDSGHFVLFRKVWRDGKRYIQGLLINQEAFVRQEGLRQSLSGYRAFRHERA